MLKTLLMLVLVAPSLAFAGDMDCGLPFAQEAGATKVNVLLEMGPESDDRVRSAVAARIRAISDIEVVYTDQDADLVVSVLGMALRNQPGYLAGYAVSIVVSDPCSESLPNIPYPPVRFHRVRDHQLFTGNDPDEIASRLVAAADTGDFEPMRAEHAMYKKAAKLIDAAKKNN